MLDYTTSERASDSVPKPNTCPRCGGMMLATLDEPLCSLCGHQDYSAPVPSRIRGTLFESGVSRIWRYVGKSPIQRNTVVRVRVLSRGEAGWSEGYARLAVTCPFCSRRMAQANLSGKGRHYGETRWRCPLNHRITLVQDIYEDIEGWK